MNVEQLIQPERETRWEMLRRWNKRLEWYADIIDDIVLAVGLAAVMVCLAALIQSDPAQGSELIIMLGFAGCACASMKIMVRYAVDGHLTMAPAMLPSMGAAAAISAYVLQSPVLGMLVISPMILCLLMIAWLEYKIFGVKEKAKPVLPEDTPHA